MKTEDHGVDQQLAALKHYEPSDTMKEALKEALSEWLDQKFALVGKFTVNGILAAGLAALVYFILAYGGWKYEP